MNALEVSDYEIGVNYLALNLDGNHPCENVFSLENINIQENEPFNATVVSSFGCKNIDCHSLVGENIFLIEFCFQSVPIGTRNGRCGRVL